MPEPARPPWAAASRGESRRAHGPLERRVDAHSDWPIQALPWDSYLRKFLLPKSRDTASPHFTGSISLSKDSDAFLACLQGYVGL